MLESLRDHFDEVLERLEAAAGRQTRRFERPVLILGKLVGVQTGIRQLRRTTPLETEVIAGLKVPTLAEMARIKAWLLITRYTTRDYLDTVVLLEKLGPKQLGATFAAFDAIYHQDTGASPLVELGARLAEAAPADAPEVDLHTYKGLQAPWNGWEHLRRRGRYWSEEVARLALAGRA